MLVHIERENGGSTSQGMAMVRSPLINEFAVARRPRQQHPAGASAEGLAHSGEFRAPPLERAEIAGQYFLKGCIGLTRLTEAIDEMLMTDHRVHVDQFFALATVNQRSRRAGIVES